MPTLSRSTTIKFLTPVLLCLLLLDPGAPQAGDVPHLLNFQGRLDDDQGQVVPDGVHMLTFRLFNAPSGGILLWQETQNVTTTDGLFNVLLGGVVPIPDIALDADSCYLELEADGGPPLSPRARLTSVAYARKAGVAGRVGSSTESDLYDALQAHAENQSAHHPKTLSAGELITGTLDPARLPPKGIDSSHIKNNAVNALQLQDEPGIAHTYVSLKPISGTMQIVDSAYLVAPSFGHVLILASGWFFVLHNPGGEISAKLSLSTSRTVHDEDHTAHFEVRSGAPAGGTTGHFMIQRVMTVSPGPVKVFLLGHMAGNEFPTIQNVHINTIYFPTSYGEIDNP